MNVNLASKGLDMLVLQLRKVAKMRNARIARSPFAISALMDMPSLMKLDFANGQVLEAVKFQGALTALNPKWLVRNANQDTS